MKCGQGGPWSSGESSQGALWRTEDLPGWGPATDLKFTMPVFSCILFIRSLSWYRFMGTLFC